MRMLQVIDSHTAGEPTRVVIAGGPELSGSTLAECRTELASHHDWIRTSLVREPRGSEVMVGAYLCAPHAPNCVTGVVFFNNTGYLGMCGHGLIGVITTLHYQGRIGPGIHRVDTPAGVVSAEVLEDGRVAFENVPCYRWQKDVTVRLSDGSQVVGEVAWGGNWFFLVGDHGQEIDLRHIDSLMRYCQMLRQGMDAQGITAQGGEVIDHLELYCADKSGTADAKNFVYCPGGEYDRSPCGTGTSAKLACLAAAGKLAEGEIWRQASVVGTLFEGSYRRVGEMIVPRIVGRAFINGEMRVIFDPHDPFQFGM